ncbi:MAG: fibronectin type III-like domain-contianing protein, partial [Terriglobia bacterium]
DYSMQNRTYRYFHGKPLYTFGYGLSYSSFAFSKIRLSAKSLHAGQPLTVTADVRNTSKVAGDEVAELYMSYPPSQTAPIRALKGFERIHLAPGETRGVTFTLSPRDLSQVTEKGEHRILHGSYSVYASGSQPAAGAEGVKAAFTITGSVELPR